MTNEDLQWLRDTLADRTDFRHPGQDNWQDERVATNWHTLHPESSAPGSRSDRPPVAAPLHALASHEVPFEDLEDLMAALFASQADFDELQFEDNGPLDGAEDETRGPLQPLQPHEIADDGWPKWLKRVDFSQPQKSPFKVLFLVNLFLLIYCARY